MTDQSTLERFEHRPADFVGVATPTLVYIGLADRRAFDMIDAPCQDHGENENGHVLTKAVGEIGNKEVCIIFQYWIKSLTPAAFRADMDARLAAKAARERAAIAEQAA